MIFAKYYDVTDFTKKMVQYGAIDYEINNYEGIYVCKDTLDFWICRILKGYNEEYDEDENSYLVERDKFSIYDVLEKMEENLDNINLMPKFSSNVALKNKIHDTLDKFSTREIIKTVLMLDNIEGYSNYDCVAADSLEEAIEMIDDRFGIEVLEEDQ